MLKEETLLQKRFAELSANAYQRGIAVFSDFLNLNELNILHTMPKPMVSTAYETFGGYVCSERQMAVFLPDALSYEYKYPISILRIRPLNCKFAEALTHRDYLGALMNLGIERRKIGDILVMKDDVVLFVEDGMAPFIAAELTRIRHTTVSTTIAASALFEYEPRFEEKTGTVASVRLDALLSLAFAISRSKAVVLIEGGKVFVNGKLITTNGCPLKDNDIISVRGIGRFQYVTSHSQSKKGRYFVSVKIYL